MWVSKREYEDLKQEVLDLKTKLLDYEDESGESLIRRLTRLAKMAKIDIHTEEYQTMMSRVFLDVGGRDSKVLRAYSGTAFMKDNPEEILARLKKYQQEASIITKQLEGKK